MFQPSPPFSSLLLGIPNNNIESQYQLNNNIKTYNINTSPKDTTNQQVPQQQSQDKNLVKMFSNISQTLQGKIPMVLQMQLV